jgi:hypothetical protein
MQRGNEVTLEMFDMVSGCWYECSNADCASVEDALERIAAFRILGSEGSYRIVHTQYYPAL